MEKIAYCGFNCLLCPLYEKEPKNEFKCGGCIDKPISYCKNCEIKKCAENKGLENCGECETFPCEKLDQITPSTKEYLTKVHENIFKNKE